MINILNLTKPITINFDNGKTDTIIPGKKENIHRQIFLLKKV